ncbi:helix-turn-helix domain-containing protein [Streptomyces sp. TRM 70351]|uniref:GlxA family transcriptional regulator n=1 Tax=Streptomyces sp. TRM 70351 TaxID=3116552 RepID=UPI002E7B9799|nr:helix-turn-helix domain-containing protein [Streptomyces sp. TRM 70351]MEE1928007.1 helix-turn-helix domain-containing protein [Streptomyces sp. TRM 70351]
MSPRRTVSVLATPSSVPFELGNVGAVFGTYLHDLIAPHYELTVCVETPGPLPLGGGAALTTPHGLDALASAGTVIVPSCPDPARPPSPRLVEALRRAHHRGARLVSTCTGAFTLAATGLLDGRRATTHWRHADALQTRFPHVQVDPAPLYIDEGDILTSAGSAAGLDLCLYLLREDHGTELANTVARRLVTQPHRDGGQAQYIETAVLTPPQDGGVVRSMDWALEHLAEPITVATLAGVAHMSERTYLRTFARTTGTTPIRWLLTHRVRASLPLLETTEATIEEIASAVGFDSPTTYRHHFTRQMRTSPTTYRKTFRTPCP